MFKFVDNVKSAVYDIYKTVQNSTEAPQFTLNLNHKYLSGKIVVVDLSWYAPYKKYGDLVICLFVYCAYIWHIFHNASSIIAGVSSGFKGLSAQGRDENTLQNNFSVEKKDL